ncbi:MAG: hypothetical protein HYZ42_01830 [Bacteroidetes bacterium]|nr:hypothetical protein [Bacteroidota bacterium]
MNRIYILILVLICFSKENKAQYTITTPRTSVEFSGLISFDYNYRFLTNAGVNPDYQKNKFELGNARFKLEGRSGTHYEYGLQLDLSRLGFTGDIGEFPALLDASVMYKSKLVDVTGGYQKLPYSRSSLVPFQYQPMWQRAEVSRGYLFSRRDVGVTLSKEFWNDRIAVFAGAYSGMGEYIVTSLTGGDNDKNGKLEYIGRAEINYPYKIKYRDVYDTHHSMIPSFSLGLNGRYVKRSESIPYGTTDFDLKIISGKKTTYGLDLAAQYRGFSALFEIHQMKIEPTTKADIDHFLLGKQTTYFYAGGVAAQLAYYNKKYKSGLIVRYDELTPNDLRSASYKVKNISTCYNLLLNGYKSMLRIQYWYRVDKNPQSGIPQKFRDDQIRIGWQYSF